MKFFKDMKTWKAFPDGFIVFNLLGFLSLRV